MPGNSMLMKVRHCIALTLRTSGRSDGSTALMMNRSLPTWLNQIISKAPEYGAQVHRVEARGDGGSLCVCGICRALHGLSADKLEQTGNNASNLTGRDRVGQHV